jgi:ankyrin repeat protein
MVLLLERGAGMEERTTDGYTALIVAARLGRTDIVNLLLEEGADGRARDEFGKSAAYYARKEGRLAALQSLQKHVSAVRVPPTLPPPSPPFRRHKA